MQALGNVGESDAGLQEQLLVQHEMLEACEKVRLFAGSRCAAHDGGRQRASLGALPDISARIICASLHFQPGNQLGKGFSPEHRNHVHDNLGRILGGTLAVVVEAETGSDVGQGHKLPRAEHP